MIIQDEIIKALISVCATFLSTFIIFVFGYFVAKKTKFYVGFAKKFEKHGVRNIYIDNTPKNKGLKNKIKKYKGLKEINIMFVSGYNFFKDERNQDIIINAMLFGATVKILLSRKATDFIHNIEQLEKNFGARQDDQAIDIEEDVIHELLSKIERKYKEKLEGKLYVKRLFVKYYTSEYRLPLYVFKYNEKDDNYKTVKTWLEVTLPPYKSQDSFMLYGNKTNFDESVLHYDTKSESLDFCEMICSHFNNVWDQSFEWEDIPQEYYSVKLRNAKESMQTAKENGHGVLLVVSAQHPLNDDGTPGEEFLNRLNAALNKYKELLAINPSIKIRFYIPGSKHKSLEKTDVISLSLSGKNYLVSKGIPINYIYGDESNYKYKAEKGVYSSADECYVASKLFFEEKFSILMNFCSPILVLRNYLFFIEHEIIPQIYSVPNENCFHNIISEISSQLPYTFAVDHSWQGENSMLGNKSRFERKAE